MFENVWAAFFTQDSLLLLLPSFCLFVPIRIVPIFLNLICTIYDDSAISKNTWPNPTVCSPNWTTITLPNIILKMIYFTFPIFNIRNVSYRDSLFRDALSPHPLQGNSITQLVGGLIGRPQTLRPQTNILDWCINAILHITYTYCIMHIKTGMYHSRDIVIPERLILGTRGPRKFVRGHIVSGGPITLVTFHMHN